MSRSYLVVALGLVLGLPVAGCASVADDSESSTAELSTTVHEPQGEERKAILAAFRDKLSSDLHGQTVIFNATDPVGRFLAHGDWAYFEGILEGPDANRTPINYANSIYKDEAANGFLGGVQRNGNFAAKFQALAHKGAEGKWTLATEFGDTPTYSVGPRWAAWHSWTSLPTPAQRDIFASFPVDDVHEPQGDERTAILAALTAQITSDVNGQTASFNHVDPAGTFLSHDGWAFFGGIIEGPNGNATPIDYRNSTFAQTAATTAFKGVLKNNNFAAVCRALLKKNPDGTWQLAATKNQDFSTPGYTVGTTNWVGDPTSDWAWDIFGASGNGNGDGDGDGDGDGG
jgi:hypothetical protein